VPNSNHKLPLMDDLYSTEIRVKKYVKQFAIVNFGEPCDFSQEKYIQKLVLTGIKRLHTKKLIYYDVSGNPVEIKKDPGFLPCEDRKIPDEPITRPAVLRVRIPVYMIYNYGWEVSKTYQREVNSILESNAKVFMRTMVASHYIIHGCLDSAIYHFQEKFAFHDHIWESEAIKKDLQRFGLPQKYTWHKPDFNKINNYFLKILSSKRTITHLAQKEYELH